MLKIIEKRPLKDTNLLNMENRNNNFISYRILLNNFPELEENLDSLYSKYKDMITPNFNHLSYFKETLKGLDEAKTIIEDSIKNNKKILAISDFDCDGINSAVVIYKFFKYVFKYPIDIVVNKRKHGNGINKSLIDTIEDIKSYGLLITSDHGSSSEETFKEIKKINNDIKIVVTDHHTIPEDNYPVSADAIVNPWISEDAPYKNLSGCAIAYLTLIQMTNWRDPDIWLENTNLVAENLMLTVVSDVMSASDSFNRFICYLGLNKINTGNTILFNILKGYYKFGKVLTIDNVRYNISPLINSGNRTHNEDLVYKFLISEDPDEILSMLETINTLNKRRREFTNNFITKAIEEDKVYGDNVKIVFLNTELGVNGIIAGKIGEIYQKPCICFLQDGEDFHGSCRSIISNFSILEKIKDLKEKGLVEKVGGHNEACGCLIKKEHIVNFVKEINEISKDIKKDDQILVDAYIDFNNLDIGLAKEAISLEPFGKDLDIPSFYSDCIVESAYHTDKMSYVTLMNDKGIKFKACAFNTGGFDIKKELKSGYRARIVYTLGMSYFKETHKLNIVITNAECLGFNESFIEGVLNV